MKDTRGGAHPLDRRIGRLLDLDRLLRRHDASEEQVIPLVADLIEVDPVAVAFGETPQIVGVGAQIGLGVRRATPSLDARSRFRRNRPRGWRVDDRVDADAPPHESIDDAVGLLPPPFALAGRDLPKVPDRTAHETRTQRRQRILGPCAFGFVVPTERMEIDTKAKFRRRIIPDRSRTWQHGECRLDAHPVVARRQQAGHAPMAARQTHRQREGGLAVRW